MTPAHSRATSAYRNVGLETSGATHDQHQLVSMMFESVLESLAVARGAIESGDTALKIKHIDKTIRIVQEGLRTSLDLDNGGELAQNLAALYDYAVVRLTQANATNDGNKLQEIAQLFKPVAEAWSEIRPGQTAPSTSPSAANTQREAVAPKPASPASKFMAVPHAYAAFAGA